MTGLSLPAGVPTTPSTPTAAPVQRAYLRQKEACLYLGMGKFHLIHLERAGRGPRKIRIDRSVFYRIADLDAWMDGNVEVRNA